MSLVVIQCSETCFWQVKTFCHHYHHHQGPCARPLTPDLSPGVRHSCTLLLRDALNTKNSFNKWWQWWLFSNYRLPCFQQQANYYWSGKLCSKHWCFPSQTSCYLRSFCLSAFFMWEKDLGCVKLVSPVCPRWHVLVLWWWCWGW